jgi:subtilisin family serine protease
MMRKVMMKARLLAIAAIAAAAAFGCSGALDSGLPASGDAGAAPSTASSLIDPGAVERQVIVKVVSDSPLGAVDAAVRGGFVREIASFGGYAYYSYSIPGGEAMADALARIRGESGIVSVEQDSVERICVVPNDADYSGYQYAPQLMGLPAAWDVTLGSASVKVAVVDTGINGLHEDFASGQVLAGYNEVAGTAISAAAQSDDNGHGTHVAGIIGAVGNNGKGIAGTAWNTKLVPVKVFDGAGSGSTSNILAGFIWAADHGAAIINYSGGGSLYSSAFADAVAYAISLGVTVVTAMGNEGVALTKYPAAYPGVIAVASSNGRDEISGFSTQGSHCSVAAPGETILSLSGSSNSGYVYMSGTSMATPYAAGVAALLKARTPSLTPAQIRSILEDSAVDLGTAGFDPEFGYGRIDAASALLMAERDNYGTISVSLSQGGSPLAGAEVLVLNSGASKVLRTGLTSSGSTGGTAGRADFLFMHTGTYTILATYGGTTRRTTATIGAGGTVDPHSLTF